MEDSKILLQVVLGVSIRVLRDGLEAVFKLGVVLSIILIGAARFVSLMATQITRLGKTFR